MADERLSVSKDDLPPDAEIADLAREQLQLQPDADLAEANKQANLGRVARLRSQMDAQKQSVQYEDDRLGIPQKPPHRIR